MSRRKSTQKAMPKPAASVPRAAPPAPIVDEITTGPLYRSDSNRLLPVPGSEKRVRREADPEQEYVAGGPFYLAATYIRSLAFAVDDVTADFGDDLYDRMLLDGQVKSDIDTLRMAILAEGVQVLPAVTQWQVDPATGEREEHPDWPLAKEIADFCERNLADLSGAFHPQTGPLYWAIYELLLGMAYGNKVAEKIYELAADGLDAGRLCLKALKCKPRRSVAFVVDPYKNVVGLLALVPGSAMPVLVQSLLGDPSQVPNLLPRAKFCVFSYAPRDADPRGTSLLRAAYDAWFVKQQIKQERLAYLARFTGGGIIGYTAPDAQQTQAANADGSPQFDMYGNPVWTMPETAMLNALIQWRNGAVAAFPSGAKVDVTYPQPENPFDTALDRQDREITQAILGQTRATMEAQNGSRADSETGQDILGLRVAHGKAALALMLRHDILRDLVRINFGGACLRLLPGVLLSRTQQQDFAASATAVAALQTSGYLSASQYPEVDGLLGLPLRTMEEAARMGPRFEAPHHEPEDVKASQNAVSPVKGQLDDS